MYITYIFYATNAHTSPPPIHTHRGVVNGLACVLLYSNNIFLSFVIYIYYYISQYYMSYFIYSILVTARPNITADHCI